jgi:chorismate mutase
MDTSDLIRAAIALVVAYFIVLKPVLSYLSRRMLLAQVAAELKAQSGDQKLVESVCFTPAGAHIISELANERFWKRNKLRYFLITTFLLAETMCILGVGVGVKGVCLEMINQRRARIQSLVNSGQADAFISEEDLNDLDEKIDLGMQLYQTERREFMLKNAFNR